MYGKTNFTKMSIFLWETSFTEQVLKAEHGLSKEWYFTLGKQGIYLYYLDLTTKKQTKTWHQLLYQELYRKYEWQKRSQNSSVSDPYRRHQGLLDWLQEAPDWETSHSSSMQKGNIFGETKLQTENSGDFILCFHPKNPSCYSCG